MQYAIVDGGKAIPAPKLKGSCPMCGDPVQSKCGTKVVWHWAHRGRLHCDSWWENETAWHRAWKACFPEECREIVRFDDKGEKHVADVLTKRGMVLEFQNSPMAPEELAAREAFYGHMIWIVNAAAFARFTIMSPVPDADSELGKDLVFSSGQHPIPTLKPSLLAGLMFWRRSQHPDHKKGDMVEIRCGVDFRDDILNSYRGHHLFHWVRPKSVWFGATKPVFFDFGDELLWRLELRHAEYNVYTVRRTLKSQLVHKNGGDCAAIPEAGGESPIDEKVDPDALRAFWATRHHSAAQ